MAIERAGRLSELRTPVISGGPGSGKSTLSKILRERYSIQYEPAVRIVSAGDMLREHHVRLTEVNPNFDDWYAGLKAPEVKALNDRVKEMFEGGFVIGESRFVGHLDRERCLFVYIDAIPSIKALRLSKDSRRAEYYGKPVEEIEAELRDRKKVERRIVRKLAQMYGLGTNYNYTKRSHYDLVINSALVSTETQADLVATCLTQRRP